MRAGFPHSDICGSKLVCQLPAAFRRLPRPSSPVIAKASTACTSLLDPITVSTLAASLPLAHPPLQASHALSCHICPFCKTDASIQSIKPSRSSKATPSPAAPDSRPRRRSPRAQPSARRSFRSLTTSSSLLKNSRPPLPNYSQQSQITLLPQYTQNLDL